MKFLVSPQIKLSARYLCIETVGCVRKIATSTRSMRQHEINVSDLACDETFRSALAGSSTAGYNVLMVLTLCVLSMTTVVRQSHGRAGNIWHTSRISNRRPYVQARQNLLVSIILTGCTVVWTVLMHISFALYRFENQKLINVS